MCSIAFGAWYGVCVWYSLWGLGWGLCVVWCLGLGMGSVCGMVFGAWDGVCVVQLVGLGMGSVCGMVFGVWYNQWGLGQDLHVV